MNRMNRRQFMETTTLAALAGGLGWAEATRVSGAEPSSRRMTMDLVCGNIGVSAGQKESIDLAARHGFESVGVQPDFLASLSNQEMEDLAAEMRTKKIVFGAANLPVEFRRDEAAFAADMGRLPRLAAALQRAGVTRMSTWLMPCHGRLTYHQNFGLHVTRLRDVARLLGGFNVRLGLEYVGPKTTWSSQRFPFIHTLVEMRELLAAIDEPNLGVLLDSWHSWHSGDTEAELLSLRPEQVVAVDINDAPAGVPKDQQVDGKRELPCATGVIDIGAFMNALARIGYDGPVRAEPFNQALRKLPKEDACAATAQAMKKAFATIG